MKILIVHNRYQIPGGEDQVAAQEAELLRAHGHQVFTYSRDNGELKTFSLWQKLALPFWTLYNPKTYRDIRRLVRENRIDVVHVHNTLMLPPWCRPFTISACSARGQPFTGMIRSARTA